MTVILSNVLIRETRYQRDTTSVIELINGRLYDNNGKIKDSLELAIDPSRTFAGISGVAAG